MSYSFQFETLTEINIDDFLAAWGMGRFGFLRGLARPAAEIFAREMMLFDEAVGAGNSLKAGGIALCRRYTGGVVAAGLEHIPSEGPVLVLSNHPGLADTIALFASIPRDDLRVIALDRPFLRALPQTSQRLFYLPDEMTQRAGVTRSVANFIKRGGAALTFPGGHIEPDPAYMSGAVESLASWSESIGLFARLVPQVRIVVAVVSHIYSRQAFHSPLAKIRRTKKDQELLSAALQILWRPYQNNVVHIAFAPPLLAADLLKTTSDLPGLTRAVTHEAQKLLENPPMEWVKQI